MMDLKKFFIYFLLPMLTIIIMPNKASVVDAIVAGIFLGSVRCLWEWYHDRKQEINN